MALRRALARLRRVAGREASSLGAALPIRHVRYGSLADISERTRDVRFTPESGHAERQHRRPLSAISRLVNMRSLLTHHLMVDQLERIRSCTPDRAP